MFFDSHCHLADKAFDEDRAEVIDRARQTGLSHMLTIAVDASEVGACLALADEYEEIYVAAAQHPHEAGSFTENDLAVFTEAYKHPKVIGIGEIGLDYWYDFGPRELQKSVLRTFFQLALEYNKPAIIHLRDPKEGPREASDDFRRIIDNVDPDKKIRGILHCYSGTLEFAEEFIDRGFLVSLPGILTFRKAEELQEIAKSLPLTKLLVETDCPYLAPVPRRGKRNEPAFVRYTAQKLAEIRATEQHKLDRTMLKNFKDLFHLN